MEMICEYGCRMGWDGDGDGMGASLLLTPDFAPGSNDSPQAFMLYIS